MYATVNEICDRVENYRKAMSQAQSFYVFTNYKFYRKYLLKCTLLFKLDNP